MGSVTGFANNVASPLLLEVQRRVGAEIAANGAFRIRTDVACFVAH
jgi:hypothetical protein